MQKTPRRLFSARGFCFRNIKVSAVYNDKERKRGVEGMVIDMSRCKVRLLGICALALGLGILITAIFPVGCLLIIIAFLLIGCGFYCAKNNY